MQRDVQPGVIELSWTAFDEAIAWMAAMTHPDCRRIYAVPRGGLPIGVALSHRLGLPLLLAMPRFPLGTLVVDDIADSGRTLAGLRRWIKPLQVMTWVRRYSAPAVCQSLMEVDDDRWVLFPWENWHNWSEDRAAYLAHERRSG